MKYYENVSMEKFLEIKENTDSIVEYIDGTVYMSPSPSTKQRISGTLFVALFQFLQGKNCEVFHAPFDIELQHENISDNKIVVPDLSVICNKSGLDENKYTGVPTLIIEILSPSNQSHDLVVKLNLYMKYGVNEYWIVNPMLNIVQVYCLDKRGQYNLMDVFKEKGKLNSETLKGFTVNVEEIIL